MSFFFVENWKKWDIFKGFGIRILGNFIRRYLSENREKTKNICRVWLIAKIKRFLRNNRWFFYIKEFPIFLERYILSSTKFIAEHEEGNPRREIMRIE